MPPWPAKWLLVPVILLMVSVSQSAAGAELAPQLGFVGLPPAPVVIGLPEPSRFRPGNIIRQADGNLAYVAALIQMEKPPGLLLIWVLVRRLTCGLFVRTFAQRVLKSPV